MISQDHTWPGPVGLLVLGMGALRPAFLNRHLGGQNAIHRAFAAQVDLFVEAWPPPRRVSGPRTAPNTACRRPRLVPSRSMPGRASGGAAVARLMGLDDGTTSIGRPRGPRTHTDVLSQLIGRLQEFVPSSRLIPSSPATFPCTSMIRCAFLLTRAAFRDLLSFGLGRVSSTGPSATRYAPPCATVRCDEYRPCLTHLAGLGAPVRFFDDPPCTTERTAAVAASTSGPHPRFAWPPRFQGHYHSLPFSLAVPTCSFSLPSPYSNSLRAPCLTYVGREGTSRQIADPDRPSAEQRTMLALSTTRCGVVRLFTNRSKRLRSPRRNRILRTGSPMRGIYRMYLLAKDF